MPRNKFDGYYYGVGLKLDEKSINDVSNQLENKLNKTVTKVTQQISDLTQALNSGAKADLGPLLKSLNDAAAGLSGVNDADFKHLKLQVDHMEEQFKDLSKITKQLGVDIEGVASRFDGMLSGLSNKIERYMQQPTVMRDNLKADLKNMANMAKSYAELLKINPEADTSGLTEYFTAFKKEFGKIAKSGLGDFSTKEIAEGFLGLADALRQIGAPVDNIRAELTGMTSQLEGAFKLKDPTKALQIFDNVGYKIDSTSAKLLESQRQLQKYESDLARLNKLIDKNGNAKFSGGTIATEDKALNLEERIEKIKQYDEQLDQFEQGSNEWINIYKKQVSLIQQVEKELEKVAKSDPTNKTLTRWNEYLLDFGLEGDDKLSADKLIVFGDQISSAIDIIEKQRKKLDVETKKLSDSLAQLIGVQQKTDSSPKKTNKGDADHKTQKSYILDLSQDVELKPHINETEWLKSINAALQTKIEPKVKPIRVPIDIKDADKIAKKIREIQGMDILGDGKAKTGKNAGQNKDIETFNKRFNALKKTIEDRKKELSPTLKEWQDAFNKAFVFDFRINGLKKGEYGNLEETIAQLVDDINIKLESKPLTFTSNIDKLIEEIQSKLDNIEIGSLKVGDISAGNISGGNIFGGGGISPIVNLIVGALNGASGAASSAAKSFEEAGQEAKQAGDEAEKSSKKSRKSNNEANTQPTKTRTNKQVQELVNQYLAIKPKSRESFAKKSPKIAGAMNELAKNPTFDNYRDLILKIPELMNVITKISSGYKKDNNPVKQFLNQIAKDRQEYEKFFGKPTVGDEARQRNAELFENGKQIVQYLIEMSKMAAKIKPLASKPGVPISYNTFKGEEVQRWIAGQLVSRDDIGTIVGKKDVTDNDVDAFLQRMGMTRKNLVAATDKDTAQYLVPLFDAINDFYEKQEILKKALVQLSKVESMGSFVGDFNSSENKSEFLTKALEKNVLAIIKDGENSKIKNWQNSVRDVFDKHNINNGAIFNSARTGELWSGLAENIFNKEKLDFNELMNDLRAIQNPAKGLQQFIEILGIAKRFSTELKSLENIGHTANVIIDGGPNSVVKKRVKKYNEHGMWTGEYATDDSGNPIERTHRVKTGIRGLLNQYGIVLTDGNGQSFGYRAGKGSVQDGLFGNKNPFTTIARELTRALKDAINIEFDRRSTADGLSVKKYTPYTAEPTAPYGQDLYYNRDLAKSKVDWYAKEVTRIGALLKTQESNYNIFSGKNGKVAYNDAVIAKMEKNPEYAAIRERMSSKTATQADIDKLSQMQENAEKELKAQAESLSKTMVQTKKDLEAAEEKLKQANKDFKEYNSKIGSAEKKYKQKEKEYSSQPDAREPERKQATTGQGGQVPGGISLNLGSGDGSGVILSGVGDIATETTLRAIYNALVGKTGSDDEQLNAQIKALEDTIKQKEAEAKQQKQQEQPKQETKKKEETKKKPTEKTAEQKAAEAKATQEKKAKEEAERKAKEAAAKAEQEKKAAEEKAKAEQAKAEQEKKAAEAKAKAEQAKAEQERKAKEAASKKTSESKNTQQSLDTQDEIQKSIGKTEKDLFKASTQYQNEVNSFIKIFREHSFGLNGGIVKQVKVGTFAKAPAAYDYFETRGHIHPHNSLYSSTDIENITKSKANWEKYDTDVLITPDFVYKFKNVQKTSTEAFNTLKLLFDEIESAGLDAQQQLVAKRSAIKSVKERHPESNIDFSIYTKNIDGSLTDITNNVEYISSDMVDRISETGKTLKRMRSIEEKYNHRFSDFTQDKEYIRLNEYLKQTNPRSELRFNEKYNIGSKEPDKLWRSATALQDALNNDWDLMPLMDAFKGFMERLSGVEDSISPDSPYFKIKKSFEEHGSDKNFLNDIKPLLKEFLGVAPEQKPDRRLSKEYSERYKFFDSLYPGWKDKPYYEKIDDGINLSGFDNVSLADLKAELARLKSLRDNPQNVQFATQAKQDEIIAILKNGVNVSGKSGGGSGESDKKQEKPNMSVSDQAKQAQDALRKESEEASIKVEDSGKQTIRTIQKIGAETAKVTKVTEDGITKTTLELDNKYATAMKALNQKLQGYDTKALFGMGTKNQDGELTEAQNALNKYIDTYYKLEDAMKMYEKSGNTLLTSGPNKGMMLQDVIDSLQSKLGGLETQLLDIARHSQEFLGGNVPYAILDGNQIKDASTNLKLLAMSAEQGGVAFNGLYNNGNKLLYDVLNNGAIKRYSIEVDEATGNVRRLELSETALVNAFQNVNKVAKQGKDLKGIFKSDDINQDATVINNYKAKLREMNTYIRQVWETARENGGLIPQSEQDKIYAMSQDVLRLGNIIQNTYKSATNFRDQGGIFDKLSPGDSIQERLGKYLDLRTSSDMLQIDSTSYDGATKRLTAKLVDLHGRLHTVKLEYNELFDAVKVTSDGSSTSVDKVTTSMIRLDQTINDALDDGIINKNIDAYKNYEKSIKDLGAMIAGLEDGTIQYNNEAIEKWKAQRELVQKLGEELVEIANQNAKKSNAGTRAINSQINNKSKVDVAAEQIPDIANTQQYKAYIVAYDAMIKKYNEFKDAGTLGGDVQQKVLQELSVKADEASNKVLKLANASKTLMEQVKSPDDILKVGQGLDDVTIEEKMRSFVGVAKDATEEQFKFNNVTKSATYTIKDENNVVHEMIVAYDEASGVLGRFEKQHYKVKTGMEKFIDSLKSKWQEVARYLMSFGSIYRVWGILRQGVTYVKEIDTALVELKKVTSETDATYAKFLQTMSKTAGKVGSTTSELTKSAADWARLGYSIEQAGKLAESTAILMNVSEFDNVETATEALISSLQAFNYTADDSIKIVDKLNIVGKIIAQTI